VIGPGTRGARGCLATGCYRTLAAKSGSDRTAPRSRVTIDAVGRSALTANYPGTVNRVVKLSDGSYSVHLFATSGPHHVFVSKDFKVTGVE
jgi:hypothetical protein